MFGRRSSAEYNTTVLHTYILLVQDMRYICRLIANNTQTRGRSYGRDTPYYLLLAAIYMPRTSSRRAAHVPQGPPWTPSACNTPILVSGPCTTPSTNVTVPVYDQTGTTCLGHSHSPNEQCKTDNSPQIDAHALEGILNSHLALVLRRASQFAARRRPNGSTTCLGQL